MTIESMIESMMVRNRNEACLSDLALDRLLAGELVDEALARANGHLGGCRQCAGRLGEIRDLAARDELQIARLARNARRGLLLRRSLSMGAALTAAAASVAIAVRVPDQPWSSQERSKGQAERLELVVRQQDGRTEMVPPGGPLSPEDAVRFRLSTGAAGHLVVVGLDAAGAVTPYAPRDGQALPVGAGSGQILAGSVILDETLGPERVFGVLCDQAIPVDDVVARARAALQQAGGDPGAVARIDVDCRQTSFLFNKVPRKVSGQR